MTEPVTITCVVEFDGTRDEYSVEFSGKENRALAETMLRRMVARKIDPTIDAEQAMFAEAMSFMKGDGDMLATALKAVG